MKKNLSRWVYVILSQSSQRNPNQYLLLSLKGVTYESLNLLRSLNELSKLARATILRLFRLYYLDFIAFNLPLDVLDTILEHSDKQPESELYRRKEMGPIVVDCNPAQESMTDCPSQLVDSMANLNSSPYSNRFGRTLLEPPGYSSKKNSSKIGKIGCFFKFAT